MQLIQQRLKRSLWFKAIAILLAVILAVPVTPLGAVAADDDYLFDDYDYENPPNFYYNTDETDYYDDEDYLEDYFIEPTEEVPILGANAIVGGINASPATLAGHFGGFNSHRFSSTLKHPVGNPVFVDQGNGWFWQSGTNGDDTAEKWGHIAGATTAFVQNPLEIYFTAEQNPTARPLLVFRVDAVAGANPILLVHCVTDSGVYDVLNNLGRLAPPLYANLADNWSGFWGPVNGHDISGGNLPLPAASDRTFHFLTDAIGNYTITVAVVDAAGAGALLLGPVNINIEITPVPIVGNAYLQANLEKGFDMFDFVNNRINPVFNNAVTRVIQEEVWIESSLDLDRDGQRDLLRVQVRRPIETLPERGGLIVPVVSSITPYDGGNFPRPQRDLIMHQIDTDFAPRGVVPTQHYHTRFLGHNPAFVSNPAARVYIEHEISYLYDRIYGPPGDMSYMAMHNLVLRRINVGPEASVSRYRQLLEYNMMKRQAIDPANPAVNCDCNAMLTCGYYHAWHRTNFSWLPPARTPIGSQRDGSPIIRYLGGPVVVFNGSAGAFGTGAINIPRGIAVTHVAYGGSLHSQGMLHYSMYEEGIAAAALTDWLNGRIRAFACLLGEVEVEAYWATGESGMSGSSYDGALPIAAALTGVEGLRTICPIVAPVSHYEYFRTNGLLYGYQGWTGNDTFSITMRCFGSGLDDNSRIPRTQDHWDTLYSWMRFQKHESYPVNAPGSFSAHFDERNMLLWGSDMRQDVGVILQHGINDSNVCFRNAYLLNEMYKYWGIEVVKLFFYQAAHSAGTTRAGSWLNRLFPLPDGSTIAGYRFIEAWLDHYLWGIENNVVEKAPGVAVESNIELGQWAEYTSNHAWPAGNNTMQRLFPTGGRVGNLSLSPQANVVPLTFRDYILVRDVDPIVRPNRGGTYFDDMVAGFSPRMRATGYEREAGYYRGHGLQLPAAQRSRWKNWIVGGTDATNAWANQRAGHFPNSACTWRFATSAAAMDAYFDLTREIPDRLLFTMPVEENFTISGVVAITAEVAADQNWGVLSAMLIEISGTNIVRMVSQGSVSLRHPNPAGTLSFEVPALANVAYGGHWVPNFKFQPVDIVPGNFYSYTWELDVTEYTFTAGRQIGLIIFGTDAEYTKRAFNPPEITVNLGPNTFLQLPVVGYIPSLGVTVSAGHIDRALRGQYVDVAVTLEQNLAGVSTIFLNMGYDAAVLEKVEIIPSGLLPISALPPVGANPFRLNFADLGSHQNLIGTGQLAIVRFRVLDDAALGTTPITLNVVSAYKYLNLGMVEVDAAAVNGSVTVATIIPGDVNGDGQVTSADLMLLSLYLAGHPVQICYIASDVNGDGRITSADLMLLSLYLAGHPVVLILPPL